MALETYVADKAKAMARDLKTRLKLAGVQVDAEELTTKKFPVLKILADANAWIWVEISTDYAESEAEGMVNSLGLPQAVYAPHVQKVYKEPFASSSSPYELVTGKVLAYLGQMGTKVEVYTATGASAAANFAAVVALAPTVAATIPSDPVNPLTQQM